MHFYCIKLFVVRNWDRGGLTDLLGRGAEDVKCMGVENLAEGSTPHTHYQLAPCCEDQDTPHSCPNLMSLVQ